MANPPAGIPEDAEVASTGGFNKYVGPLYRLKDLEDGAVKRFAFAAAEQHMNGSGTVHGGMLMTFMDTSMSRTSRLISDAKGLAEAGHGCMATIEMPEVHPLIAPLVYAVPVQLLAYHVAVTKGTDVDQPRNLAKSVTVE